MIKKIVKTSPPPSRVALAPMLANLDRLRDELDEALATRDLENAQELLLSIRRVVNEIDVLSHDIGTPGNGR